MIGEGGFPVVDFQRGECTFCTRCVTVCKAPLFRPTTESPWYYKAHIEANCLANGQVFCQRCQDSCEPNAIRFIRCWGVCPPQRSSWIAVTAAAPACRIVRLAASRSTGEQPIRGASQPTLKQES